MFIKEVPKEVPKEILSEVPREVLSEIPREIVSEVPREVLSEESEINHSMINYGDYIKLVGEYGKTIYARVIKIIKKNGFFVLLLKSSTSTSEKYYKLLLDNLKYGIHVVIELNRVHVEINGSEVRYTNLYNNSYKRYNYVKFNVKKVLDDKFIGCFSCVL